MHVALDQLGQREIAGEANNPRIVAYHQATRLKATDDETPWCAAFVNWCLEVAGVAGTNSAAARSFEAWGSKVSTPSVGDVVVLSRGTKPWQGHVGFWLGENRDNVMLLGGNQGDAVSVALYEKSRIVSIRRAQ